MSCKQTGNGVVVEVREVDAAGASENPFLGIGCNYDITPTGISYGTVTAEQCLDETGAPSTDLGDAEADEVVVTHAYCPGGTVTELLRQWSTNKTRLELRIVYPANGACSGPITEQFIGRIRVFKPNSITKTEFMKLPVTFLRDGGVTVTCNGTTIASTAALTALNFAGLTNGESYLIGTSLWVWEAGLTPANIGGNTVLEPDDKPTPGVDAGYWVERPGSV